MVQKGIRGGICHAVRRYAKANNEHVKNHVKSKESSYIIYLDASNLYGWAMSRKLPVNGFKWVKKVSRIDEDFIMNFEEDSNKGYIIEIDIEYPRELHKLHSNLPFFSERMKINKCNKLVCNLHDKKTMLSI